MSSYEMSTADMVSTMGSSKGTQIKFYKDGYWYKIDETGREGLAEFLVSKVLGCSNVPSENYVSYEMCEIELNGKVYNGCRSESFLKDNEQYISYDKLYSMYHNQELGGIISLKPDPAARIGFVADFIQSKTGLDIHDYISATLSLDMFTVNPDRHFNNLGVIVNTAEGTYRNPPIFDNGAALLTNISKFPPGINIMETCQTIVGRPFAASLEYQAVCAGLNLEIDFGKLKKELKSIALPETREIRVLRYQCGRYEKDLGIQPRIKQDESVLGQKIAEAEEKKGKQKECDKSTRNNDDIII